MYSRRMLHLWNTLHHRLEPFIPLHDRRVGLYACGPTVYNPPTIGNWRAFVFDDLVVRTFRCFGFDVTYVMNITDVGHLVGDGDAGEDKVEREAARRGMNAWDLARSLEQDFRHGMSQLNICVPDMMPRATEHIAEQIELVRILEQRGHTYRTSDGIYFDTSTFPAYGSLSGQRLEDKQAGARVEMNKEKHQPADFALWKFSSTDVAVPRRQMEWSSPWGIGFPGWHVECSAMSTKYLGQPFDVHIGGIDHIPVHHENEIAQSEAAFGKPLARYWLHNEFLMVDGRRVGKSEGNAFTLDDLLSRGYDPLAYRYYCLGTHYRMKLNFTWEGMEGASHAWKRLQQEARSLPLTTIAGEIPETVLAAMEDDFNTPRVLAAMWEMLASNASAQVKAATLMKVDTILGLGLERWLGQTTEIPATIVRLAEARNTARRDQDWLQADALRETLLSQGWIVEDETDGYRLKPL